MNLCNDNHDEICYEGRHCPACQIYDDLRAAENEIGNLKAALENADDRASCAEASLEEFRTDIRAIARECQQVQKEAIE